MITALDTSVVLDVLTDDPRFASLSEAALRKARQQGKLIVCECAVAEIFPALGSKTDFAEFLSDWQIEFSAMNLEAAVMAGEHFATYLSRGGQAKRVVPDFLIAAHASVAADRLLARDRGYLREYFRSLDIWDPTAV